VSLKLAMQLPRLSSLWLVEIKVKHFSSPKVT